MGLTTGNLRLDIAGALSGVRRTPQGGLIAPANLTRVGVFTYTQQDGKQVRELRLPEEVFKADSLETLTSAPLTVGHPMSVTPSNYRELNVGHVQGPAKQDGKFVAADIRVMDQDTIDKVERKDLVELSCGYTCDCETTSGEWRGEKYDAIQRNIRYNHVALGPRDWGRAGNEVKVRLDSGYSVCVSTEEVAVYLDHVSVKTDQQTTTSASPATAAPSTDATEKVNLDALNGQIAFLKSENERLTRELTEAKDPKRLDSLVQARVKLETTARAAMPAEFKCDGKSDDELIREVVKTLKPEMKLDGKSADYVRGIFEMATADRADTREKQGNVQTSIPTAGTAQDPGRQDGQDGISASHARMVERNANAWKPPTSK